MKTGEGYLLDGCRAWTCELVATGIAGAQREVNRMSDKEKTIKPCPFRVYGERQASWTAAGEYSYREWFMPCMEKECACFHRDGDDAYCDRNGAYMRLTER